MIVGTLIAIFLLLTLSGFFSGSETALTAASRARMHQLEQDGNVKAARVNRLLDDRESLIGTILLGNNLVNILASVLATTVFAAWLGHGGTSMAVATAVMTVLVLVFAEVLPKTLAITRPDAMAMAVARPISWMVSSLNWMVRAVQLVVNATLRLIGVPIAGEDISADQEIRGAISLHASQGSVDDADRHRLLGALDLKDMAVSEVMIHRKNINMLDADRPARDLVMKALSSAHTRIPLYRGEREEIIGVLHAKDLLRAVVPHRGDLDELDVEQLLREPWFVPETTPLLDQLDAFMSRRSHFALVVDEYGALQGLVTLEDILEEIVGDIRDEHDVLVQGVRPQADGSADIDGWVTIRDLNRALGWSLPDDEAVTVAGLVIHEAQTIPEIGQRFAFHGYRFDIVKRHRNQITSLQVQALEEWSSDHS